MRTRRILGGAVGLMLAVGAVASMAAPGPAVPVSPDQELNQVYGQLRNALKHDEESQQSLLQAQRAWLAWRDKEADLCAQAQGWSPAGTGYRQMEYNCKERITAERVSQLKTILRDALKLQ